MKDQHNKAIPADILAEVQEKINEIAVLLKPFIINLTPEERHSRLKLGDKSLAFGEKSFEYATVSPQFRPSYLDMEAFDVDMKDTTNLRVLELSLQQLLQGVDDTVMIAGSEVYSQSLMFYNSVKEAARQNVPGAKAIYEELKIRYPGRSAAKKAE